MGAVSVKPTTLKLDEETKDRVRRLADVHQRSAHWILLEAVHQYVEREEKRESFRQDALASWAEYKETGLHVTGSEVSAWLDTWGSENEGDAPVCHG